MAARFDITEAEAERFWNKVAKGAPSECWPFTGALDRSGYGCFAIGGTHRRIASRLAWQLANGNTTPTGSVCHSCDNPQCCNPAHLFLGSQSDNLTDASHKRRVRGQDQTHCVHGHEFTPENTYWRANGVNSRQCRKCNAAAAMRCKQRAAA